MNVPKKETEENKEVSQDNQANSTNNNPSSDIAETVAMVLIDKIISTVVITNKVNETYKTLNDHCFNYLINFINPYLETNFIFYENGIEDPEYQKNKIYFDRKPLEKINTWNIISEPETNEIDRYENTKTKIMKYKKYSEMQMDGVKESSLAFDIDDENKNIHSSENESIRIQKNQDKVKEKSIKEQNKENKDISNSNIKPKIPSLSQSIKSLNEVQKKEEQKKKIKLPPRKKIMNKFSDDMAPKKKEKEEILEISVTDDLPQEAYENIYSIINSNDENNRLRRERELQIEQRQAQKLLEIEKEKRAKQKLYRRLDKDFDSNRLTFDPNGKIINLRTINENLAGDFISSRIKVKSEQNKKKELFELKDVVYPIKGMELNNINEKRNNENIMNNKEIMNKIEADISKIKVEKNFEIKKDKNNFKNNREKEKGSILPSGYNFDKFIPEVGVVVTGERENEKKEGGFEYVKKYNKPSFNELSRFISESINMNSNNFSSYLNSNSDLNVNNKSITDGNYIGYKEEFNENNPLMQNVHKMNNNLKSFSPDLKKFKSLNIQSSNSNTRRRNLLNSYDKINPDIEQYQSIQLSKNFEENNLHLKNIFDEPLTTNIGRNYLNSLNVNNFNKMDYFERAVLPFKKFVNKKKRKELNEEINKEKENQIKKNSDEAYINKFNSQIINNKDWGKEDEDPEKAQQRLRDEIENENNPKKNSRLPRIYHNNRMKNFGYQIMTEGNNIRQRKNPLFGGNLK